MKKTLEALFVITIMALPMAAQAQWTPAPPDNDAAPPAAAATTPDTVAQVPALDPSPAAPAPALGTEEAAPPAPAPAPAEAAPCDKVTADFAAERTQMQDEINQLKQQVADLEKKAGESTPKQ
jgi:hypothetical protein